MADFETLCHVAAVVYCTQVLSFGLAPLYYLNKIHKIKKLRKTADEHNLLMDGPRFACAATCKV